MQLLKSYSLIFEMLVKKTVLYISRRCASKISERLQEHKIVPDVIDKPPNEVIRVTYPCGVYAELGNILKPVQVKDEPHVRWQVCPHRFYTLCMTDPDAPSRKKPEFREWHHWLIGNIPGCKIMEGDVLSQYIGAGPPKDTGLHRYIFLVYLQAGKLEFDEPLLNNKSTDKRGKFSIRNFAKKYNLGHPVAANFFQAEYDSYVDLLYKQLGEG